MVDYEDITIERLMNAFNSRISGQEETKKKLASAVYTHYKLLDMNERKKDDGSFVKRHLGNILVYGPSGCGKTELFRSLRDSMDIPVFIVDTPSISNAGYKGYTMCELMNDYLTVTQGEPEKGILVFDEFDKILDMANADITGAGYAKSLVNEFLKLSEGKQVPCKKEDEDYIFDTSDILMVFVGSFGQLLHEREEKKTRSSEHVTGFVTPDVKKSELMDSELTLQDFLNYGVNKEFIGRISLICHLDGLDKKAMKDILLHSGNSPLKKYDEMLWEQQVGITFSDSAINYMVEKAMELNLGARGLEKIVDPYMMKVLFTVGNERYRLLRVTLDAFKKNRVPKMKYGDPGAEFRRKCVPFQKVLKKVRKENYSFFD